LVSGKILREIRKNSPGKSCLFTFKKHVEMKWMPCASKSVVNFLIQIWTTQVISYFILFNKTCIIWGFVWCNWSIEKIYWKYILNKLPWVCTCVFK
jgi:hypothetical protein